MLVITGTQRSGTTAMAECLIASGYDLGTTWRDEVGGYESPEICTFYRRYLGDCTFPFDDFEALKGTDGFITSEFVNMNYKVVKFSYLFMNPVFIYIWHKFRGLKDRFLIMDRSKINVCASKQRAYDRFQHDSLLLQQGALRLVANFNHSVEAAALLGFEAFVLPFPGCLDDISRANEALEILDPDVQITQEAWDLVIDKSKVHF